MARVLKVLPIRPALRKKRDNRKRLDEVMMSLFNNDMGWAYGCVCLLYLAYWLPVW